MVVPSALPWQSSYLMAHRTVSPGALTDQHHCLQLCSLALPSGTIKALLAGVFQRDGFSGQVIAHGIGAPAHPRGRASQLEKPSGSPPGACHLHSPWKLQDPLKWLRSTSLTSSYSPLGVCSIHHLLLLAMSGPLRPHSLP